MLEGGKKWIDLYQQILREKQTKEGYVFSLFEANMLQMENRFEEAFTAALATAYDDPSSVYVRYKHEIVKHGVCKMDT